MEQSLELGFADVISANKKQLKGIASTMIAKASEGEIDPVEAFSASRKGIDFFKQMEEGLRPLVEKDLKLEKGQDYKHNSVLFEGAVTKTEYDYEACRDPKWNDLSKQIKDLTEQKKERETFLKTIKEKLTTVDEESGEVIEIYPPVKSESFGIKVTLK